MKPARYQFVVLIISLLLFSLGCSKSKKDRVLLNVSYDPTRELYQEINKDFILEWKSKHDETVTIKQSHGGSGKQSRAVIDGLRADVVTLALGYDIDAISDKGLIAADWQSKFPNDSAPYFSTIVFLVRKGNPKKIKDWDDLVKPNIQVITANPKTSGGARWSYLAAWIFADEKFNGDQTKIKDFMKSFYKNVPVLDTGARGSTNTFGQRGIGDVLVSWENEAMLSLKELGTDKFEIVTPSISVLAEPPVAIVTENVKQNQTSDLAQAYIEFIYSERGQEIAAKNYYRPQLESVSKKYSAQYPSLKLVSVKEKFGNWRQIQKAHFSDNGIYDSIYKPAK